MRSNGLGIRLSLAAFLAFSPMIVPAAQAQDCVRTVRALSDFTIRGDAWLWWSRAEGQYARDTRPAAGSVLVFKRSGRLNRGHVSLVSRVIDSRTIEVDHTWLDGEGLRRNMRVMDVSGRGDWSTVRVWHEPSAQWGLRTYPTYGFILPDGTEPQRTGPRMEYAVAPSGRAPRGRDVQARIAEAAIPVVPARKPLLHTAAVPAPTAPVAAPAAAPVTVATVLPGVKPGSRPAAAVTTAAAAPADARPVTVAALPPTVQPARKPVRTGAGSHQVASAER
ncbi:CHAP domain-containing protein [Azospirillum halopraeferens]|uniref:CHAP domain-containing protein n=1 Tax=Azospirillum halopraeferens TaxID=34010 RepID=UPI0003FE0908|nr:CHAP domain-containing protein [Azospirillum halopraeferens]